MGHADSTIFTEGWVPESTQQGDVVAVLPGGNVPYVLRHVATNVSRIDDKSPCYTFLGDAYIQGIMVSTITPIFFIFLFIVIYLSLGRFVLTRKPRIGRRSVQFAR